MRDVIRPFNARMQAPLQAVDQTTLRRREYGHRLLRRARYGARRQALRQHLRLVPRACADGKVTAATAFFDSVEFNELWARVAPG